MNVAEYIANRFAFLGVKQSFSVTGGGAMFLNDAFASCDAISTTYNHHEQACSMAAEGYARILNLPAVVVVTTGPGGINTLTGVHGAYTDSIPMLIVSGQVKTTTTTRFVYDSSIALRQLGDQEAPIDLLVKSIVKEYFFICDPNQVSASVDAAYTLATEGRKGPVWLDIPIDIQQKDLDLRPDTELRKHSVAPYVARHQHEHPEIDRAALRSEAADVYNSLKLAERPVFLVGGGLRSAEAIPLFQEILEHWSVPTTVAWSAIDAISDVHPCHVGRPSTVGDRCGNFVIQSADLLIVLGCRLNVRQIGYEARNFASNAQIIMVDIDSREFFKPTLRLSKFIHADLREFLELLADKIKGVDQPPAHLEYLRRCKLVQSKYRASAEPRKCDGLSVYHFIERLSEFWQPGDTVVCGNGAACVSTFQIARTKPNVRIFTNSGSASMGYDLPAAIGASVATGARVWCLAGDGSIMMNIQELQTLAFLQLNIIVVILENGGYASIRMSQDRFFGRHAGCDEESDLGFPDYKNVLGAFGLKNLGRISDLSSVDKALCNAKGPAFVVAELSRNEDFAPKVAAHKTKSGEIKSASFENMSPLLDERESQKTLSWLLSSPAEGPVNP